MADNTTLNTGTGGDVIASDDIAGVKHQMVKLEFGVLDSATLVSTSNPLPVDQTNTSVADGGTLPAKGVQIGGTDGSVFQVMSTDNAGRPNVNVNGTVPVSGPLTDTQLRTTPVPVSGTVTATTGGLTDTQLRATPVPVSGTVTANAGTGTFTTQPVPVNTISTANSTTATLSGAAAFTGTSEDVSGYAIIFVTVFTSHASATDGLSLQQSSDGTNWDITDTYTIPATAAGQGKTFSLNTAGKFFRVVYTNGATLQTTFRLQAIFKRFYSKPSSQRPADGYSNEVDLEQANTFPMMWNGATWDRLTGVAATGLKVNGSGVTQPVSGTVTATGPLTDTQLRATPVPVSGTVTASGPLTDTQLRATPVPVSGTVTANLGTAAVTNAGTFAIQDSQRIADDAAFTVGTTPLSPVGYLADQVATDSVNEGDIGAARITLDRKQIVTIGPSADTEGWTPSMVISAASTNATSVKGSAGKIGIITVSNINAAVRYLKIYNKASAPTVGTDVPLLVFAIPGNTAGAGTNIPIPDAGIVFTTGIAFALTTGVATADTGAVAANEIVVNLGTV